MLSTQVGDGKKFFVIFFFYLPFIKYSLDYTTAVLLHCPYILRVGVSPCIEVRDMSTGELLKRISDNYFSGMSSNGRFLCAPESQRNSALRLMIYWKKIIINFSKGMLIISTETHTEVK